MFKILAGSVRGHAHAGGNSQDWFTYGQVDNTHFGVVVDGCSSGAHSEVGAKETTHYLNYLIELHINKGTLTHDIPTDIFQHYVRFVEKKAAVNFLTDTELSYFAQNQVALEDHPRRDDIAAYIRQHWLVTILGFIQTQEETIVFSRGDGAIRINDKCWYFASKGNAPRYASYFAIPWDVPMDALEDPGFKVKAIDTTSLNLLVVGTDSFLSHRDLFEQLPQYLRYDRELQRQLIIWSEDSDFPEDSTASEAFHDDTTAIALIRDSSPGA